MQTKTAAIIWNWKAAKLASSACQSKKRARFWLQAGVMVTVGGLLFQFTDHRIAPYFLWMLTILLLAGLLFSNRIVYGFERFGRWLGNAVGSGLTWGLLTPFFYLVFGAGRLVLMISGRDPLKRKLDPQSTTYWSAHSASETPSGYQKQF